MGIKNQRLVDLYEWVNILISDPYMNGSIFFNDYVYDWVQVGKDQEKAQSEKDSHSKNRVGKKTN